MKNYFFYKLYRFDKKLFFFLAVFSALTVVCNIMGVEITPFFIWGMYSEKESTLNSYDTYKIQVNDSSVIDHTAGFTDNNRFFLYSPLSFYQKIQENRFIDPALSLLQKKTGADNATFRSLSTRITNGYQQQARFPGWFTRYLEQSASKKIHSLKVDIVKLSFTADKHIQADSSYLLAAWEQD